MLNSYFKRQSTLTKYYEPPDGEYLDGFTNWLSQLGYQHRTILYYIRGTVRFSKWLQVTGLPIAKITSQTVNDFRTMFFKDTSQIRSITKKTIMVHGAEQYTAYLRSIDLVVTDTTPNKIFQYTLLCEFDKWMRDHRGVLDSTLKNYRRPIKELLDDFGDPPKNLTTKRIRKYIFKHAETDTVSKTKNRVNAIRMFIKFLIANNHCDSNMDKVILPIPQWKLQYLPKYIQPEEINLVIDGCDCSTKIGIRNRAIILLLAKIGLRASDVSELKLDDIDWKNSNLLVIGKNRQETKLPLSQEIGDALLDYLIERPPVNSKYIFIRTTAPWVGITPSGVSSVTENSIHKAGIDAPSYGSHVLRHYVPFLTM